MSTSQGRSRSRAGRSETSSASEEDAEKEKSSAQQMQFMIAEHIAVNKLNWVGNLSNLKVYIWATCCLSGLPSFDWSHIIPHSPANTHHLQKWCICVGAFAAVTDWTNMKQVKTYLLSKYYSGNILPVNELYHDYLEATTNEYVLAPTYEYARRAVYIVERRLKKKEDSDEAFGKVNLREALPASEWTERYSDLGETDGNADRYDVALPDPYLGQKAKVCKFKVWPFSLSGLLRSVCNGVPPKRDIIAHVPKLERTDGNGDIKELYPASFDEALPDFYLTGDIFLVVVMTMSIIEKHKANLQATAAATGIKYYDPELDELLMIFDYLLHLIESDCASYFRDIADLPAHIKTVQDTPYRPTQYLGFERPEQSRTNKKEATYNWDPLQSLVEIEQTAPEYAANVEAALAVGDAEINLAEDAEANAEATPSVRSTPMQAEISAPTPGSNMSTTGKVDESNFDGRFRLVPPSIEELVEEADEDDVRYDYMHLSNDQLVEIGHQLYAALNHFSRLRDLQIAIKIRQLGRPLAYRWVRRVKRDQFTTSVDSLDLKLEIVKEMLREEERDDLVRKIDAADHNSSMYKPDRFALPTTIQ